MNKLIILMLTMIPSVCFAQMERFYKHEIQFTGGLNSQSAYEMEVAYSFLFNKYMGITFGLNGMDQSFERVFCNNEGDYTLFQTLLCGNCYSEDDWRSKEQYKRAYANALLVRPAIRLRLPVFREDGEDILVFNMETGLLFSLIPNMRLTYWDSGFDNSYNDSGTGTVKNKGGEWLYYHLKGYLSIDLDRFLISVGYSFSDFDIYDSRRNIYLNRSIVQDTLKDRRKNSTVFFVLAYRF